MTQQTANEISVPEKEYMGKKYINKKYSYINLTIQPQVIYLPFSDAVYKCIITPPKCLPGIFELTFCKDVRGYPLDAQELSRVLINEITATGFEIKVMDYPIHYLLVCEKSCNSIALQTTSGTAKGITTFSYESAALFKYTDSGICQMPIA